MGKLESFKPSSQSNVRLRTNTYTHTCTYTTHILSFLKTRSIEMKPVFKPIKWYTHTPVLAHTHVLCQRIQRHIEAHSDKRNLPSATSQSNIRLRTYTYTTHSQFSRSSKYRNEPSFQANQMFVCAHTHVLNFLLNFYSESNAYSIRQSFPALRGGSTSSLSHFLELYGAASVAPI